MRRYKDVRFGGSANVSIHASVKDATFGRWYWWRISFVSIHASVKDATDYDIAPDKLVIVSIHASVKDATLVLISYFCDCFSFNPRICKRCDW